MGIFSKKENRELFDILEADAKREADSNKSIFASDNKIQPSHVLTVSEVLSQNENSDIGYQKTAVCADSPIEALKKRMLNKTSDTETAINMARKDETSSATTLLQKCKPYTVDEEGRDATTPKKPLYRLESVAEILENDSRMAMDRLSAKYDIMIDDLKKTIKSDKSPDDSAVPENLIIKTKNDTITNSAVTVSSYQTSLPDISDIDNLVVAKAEPDVSSEGSTIRFTPIKSTGDSKEAISISSVTNTIDLTNELGDLFVPETIQEKPQLEETEFDEFKVSDDLRNPTDAKKLVYTLSVKKRNSFLRMLGSVLLSLILICFEIPPLSDLMLSATNIMMAVCTAILAIIALINADMFLSLSKIFSRNSTTDATASLAAIGCLAHSTTAAILSRDGYELCFLCAAILSFRAIAQFLSRSSLLGNLRQICSSGEKKAITLIMDEATTFAMAKDAIDGDVLIAAPRYTNNVTDFMKYSTFGTFMNGKLPFITSLSLVLSIALGFTAASLFGEIFYGIYAAAAVLCIACMPIIFFIDALPLFDSAKKLNPKGAMIAGKTAAQRLEMANAVVLSSIDLFPTGTVTLHNMKVLSENSVDDTIVRAASLTDAVNSPLSNIFKQIAGTNASYSLPDSDTVKYEDKLGLSGWVDDELLFIGNRTLMESHGIEVPDVKLDRKILSRGYFPVYIANGNKAVALLIIQYSADESVAVELKRITDAGVTLLINNCDPNITADMICDYLGLYEDSVRVMSNAGVHMYKNAVEPQEYCSAPAAFKGKGINFISVINSASKIKKSSMLLNVLYVLIMCVGMALFAYLSFSGASSPLSPRTLMLYELGAAIAALLIYQAFKP